MVFCQGFGLKTVSRACHGAVGNLDRLDFSVALLLRNGVRGLGEKTGYWIGRDFPVAARATPVFLSGFVKM